MSSNRGRPKLEIRSCIHCGYTPVNISHLNRHLKTCKGVNNTNTNTLGLKERELQLANEKINFLQSEINHLRDVIKLLITRRRADYRAIQRRKINDKERNDILHRQDYKCTNPDGMCTLPHQKIQGNSFDIDHIVSLALGGADTNENLQALCPGCHDLKTRKDRKMTSSQVEDELADVLAMCEECV